ncbi:MAG: hypothetical protein MJK15_07075 [Colwellia sp.]|nr:hypothetical protein [Colwellia sp.]
MNVAWAVVGVCGLAWVIKILIFGMAFCSITAANNNNNNNNNNNLKITIEN